MPPKIDKQKKQCDGDGRCLIPSDKKKYKKNSTEYDCEYKCYAVACPNIKICKTDVPKYILDHNFGTCNSCSIDRYAKYGRDKWRDLYYINKK